MLPLNEIKAEARGDYRLGAELLEQAAKEIGGLFSNVRQVDGNVRYEYRHRIAPEEARKIIAEYLGERKAAAEKETKH